MFLLFAAAGKPTWFGPHDATWSGPHNASGQPHGRGVVIYADGSTAEGEYLDGKLHGMWLLKRPDGTWLERQYVDGKLVSETVRRPHSPLSSPVPQSRVDSTHPKKLGFAVAKHFCHIEQGR
jgi:hypothetical protein